MNDFNKDPFEEYLQQHDSTLGSSDFRTSEESSSFGRTVLIIFIITGLAMLYFFRDALTQFIQNRLLHTQVADSPPETPPILVGESQSDSSTPEII